MFLRRSDISIERRDWRLSGLCLFYQRLRQPTQWSSFCYAVWVCGKTLRRNLIIGKSQKFPPKIWVVGDGRFACLPKTLMLSAITSELGGTKGSLHPGDYSSSGEAMQKDWAPVISCGRKSRVGAVGYILQNGPAVVQGPEAKFSECRWMVHKRQYVDVRQVQVPRELL